ncbi:GNAT family N-acetyltransferase [Christensenellaceae bacterium OttesenSCG-928-M15]|nr:GNAT family N-acetyltransferase [Christensenellaceae bacterium OttesenSCG-928-M15]
MKNTTKTIWIKVLLFCLLSVLSVLAVSGVVITKKAATAGIVKTTQFAFARVEARQYVVQLEYGIRYGKQLEYYFNISEILQKVRASSSYIRNVYIADGEGALLYAAGNLDLPDFKQIEPIETSAAYDTYTIGNDEYLRLPISATEDGEPAGYLVVRLSVQALNGLVEREQQKSAVQSYIIGAFGLMLALILLTRFTLFRNARFRFVFCALFLSLSVLVPQGTDMALELWRTNAYVESSATQSTQRLAQTMQQQIDLVMEKGVDYARISGLDAYFAENAENIASVERFSLDANNRVSARPSSTYVQTLVSQSTHMFLELMAFETAWALVLTTAAWGIGAIISRGKRKKSGQDVSAEDLLEILNENAAQNALLIERVKSMRFADAAAEGGNVRIYDTESGNYMFCASSLAAFYRLYRSAAKKPSIFFLSNDTLHGELSQAHNCVLLEQWLMYEAAPEIKDKQGFSYGPLTLQDLDYVAETYQSEEFDREYLEKRIQSGPTLCARKNGKLMGYMLTHADGETGPLYVPPESRGNGLGLQLVCRISNAIQRVGGMPIGLIYPENEASRQLHKKVGYVPCKIHTMWVYPKERVSHRRRRQQPASKAVASAGVEA